ncbi:MAG: hypothetical protein ACOCP8_03900 [archaeon]
MYENINVKVDKSRKIKKEKHEEVKKMFASIVQEMSEIKENKYEVSESENNFLNITVKTSMVNKDEITKYIKRMVFLDKENNLERILLEAQKPNEKYVDFLKKVFEKFEKRIKEKYENVEIDLKINM